jgi:cellulose synthase/poly-beta-1,6-N-acetylglucosamine synthase-like glycosyltransferase/peptidoglycan/xylan/chitin deacetylase (PgdA/CDA1 family)
MSTPQAPSLSSSAPSISPSKIYRDVFFDPTGRRWRIIKAMVFLLTMFIVVVVAISWTPIQQPPADRGRTPLLPLPPVNIQEHAPTIGVGPLVRLVRVERQKTALLATDPVTNKPLGPITGEDADNVGGAQYAMQRYGYSAVAHKTLELTFDDGPDPIWTPKILDLLSKYKVPATFFVVGSEVVKYPDIVTREAREGFAIGNHSLTHPNLLPDQVAHEFITTDRIIRAVTGVSTNLVRLPYDGYAGKVADADRNAVMINAERLGYVVSLDEFDTNDWKYGDPALRPKTPIPLPPATADNLTLLLHDGGGNRAATLAYLERLIPWALAHGFHFYSLPQVSPQVAAGLSQVAPDLWDYETSLMYAALWAWPSSLIQILFVFAVFSVVVVGCLNITLAIWRRSRYKRRFRHPNNNATGPPVSLVIAAYNEEKVIGRTLDLLRQSRYKHISEIIVVDDGSADGTANIVNHIAMSDPRIRLLRQENRGKAVALNHAFIRAQTPVVITLDADTMLAPDTVGALARYFAWDDADRLGAVAGVVKVGNLRNLLTRWQALEYLTQIGVDRGAQDALGAIIVVPGACAAWNKDAVLQVGGYSHATLAEDCDLTLELQRAGYRVTQDDEAICYTEAPETPGALMRQRFRWMYGNIQAMWKHKKLMFNPRYGWLGIFTMPLSAISILLPVVFLPFVYLMAVVTYLGQGLSAVFLYVTLFTLAQFLVAAVGVWLTAESPVHLLITPLYRVIYEPLRAYILYKSVITVLRGTRSSWNKLQRKGTVASPLIEQADETPAEQAMPESSHRTAGARMRKARTRQGRWAIARQPARIAPQSQGRIRAMARLPNLAPTFPHARAPPRARNDATLHVNCGVRSARWAAITRPTITSGGRRSLPSFPSFSIHRP